MQEQVRVSSQTKIVCWPTPQDYNEAMQNPSLSFTDSELQAGLPELTILGLPKPVSGTFASVYKMRCGASDWAVRCFLFHVPDQHQRYELIEQHLQTKLIACILRFDHQEDGLLIRGIHFPFLKMEWCYGLNLNTYIDQNVANGSKLNSIAEEFKWAVLDLRRHGIAHGDLQHGNIMIEGDASRTKLKLVDYDGMYIPELEGYPSTELGHRNYQHPGRSKDHFGPDLDHFSAWLIYLTLKCLAIDPTLWHTLRGGDECLLLRHSDLVEPLSSHAFHVLETHANEEIRTNSKIIRYLLTLPVEQIPAIDQYVSIPDDLPNVGANAPLPDWMKDAGPSVPETTSRAVTAPASQPSRSSPFWMRQSAPDSGQTPQIYGVPGMLGAMVGVGAFLFCIVLFGILVAVLRYQTPVPTGIDRPPPIYNRTGPTIDEPVRRDTTAQSTMSVADSYYQSGDYQNAIREYTKAIKKNPILTAAYAFRALCYDGLKEYDKAIADCSTAIALNPKDPEPYSNRAYVYNHMDEFRKAIEDCSTAIRLDPKHLAGYWYRGNAYTSVGQYQRAIKDYSESLKLDPTNYAAFCSRGTAYFSVGRYKDALNDYDQAIKLYPGYEIALSNRGSAHGALGQYQKSVDDLTQAINFDPQDSYAYLNRALAYEHLGQYKKAIHDLSEVIQLNPINPEAHARRSALYKKIGNHELARIDRETAKKLRLP